MSPKPFGVCWCDCHAPVDDDGHRVSGGRNDETHVNGWPRYDAPIAMATACVSCRRDHILFIETGRDWAAPQRVEDAETEGTR